MIGPREVQRRASRLGLRAEDIERDYILNHVLAAVAGEPEGLIFRGGTALARVYWPDFRLSEDIDFITDASVEAIERVLTRAAQTAGEASGLALQLEFHPPRGGWSRSLIKWPDEPPDRDRELIIDVNRNERAYLPVETERITLPYQDLSGLEAVIPTVALAEILGNKWFMIDDAERREPRDLFDIWAGLCQFNVPFEEVRRGHKAKYGWFPQRLQPERVRRLATAWEDRLAHQVGKLPSIDRVLHDVAAVFDAWEASTRDA